MHIVPRGVPNMLESVYNATPLPHSLPDSLPLTSQNFARGCPRNARRGALSGIKTTILIDCIRSPCANHRLAAAPDGVARARLAESQAAVACALRAPVW